MTREIENSPVERPYPGRADRRFRVEDLDDEHLIALVREGDVRAKQAYAALWTRHSPAAHAAARRITASFDPDDLASEAFARVLSSLQVGRGPDLSFRAYLIVTMRNVAVGWARQAARLSLHDLEDIDTLPQTTAGLDRLDRLAGFEAFRSLPERWRKVLWHSEVDDLTPTEIGEIFGIKASAAAMLTFRARQGLRKAWLSSLDGTDQTTTAPAPSAAPPDAAIGSATIPNSRRSAE